MPTYVYGCRLCEAEAEEFKKISERFNAPTHCGEPMKLLIASRYVIADIEPYYDDQLDVGIKSRQHRKEVMREKEVYDKRDFKGQKWRKNNPAYKG